MLSEKSRQALAALKAHTPFIDQYQTSKRSAVLVGLVTNAEGELEVILTVRSSALRTNAGDSAFPGGKKKNSPGKRKKKICGVTLRA